MAVSARRMTRHHDYSRLFIALAVLAGVIALAPILGAVIGLSGASVAPKTAFATAPSGEYVVLGRSEGTTDIISVARPDSPGAVNEIARIPHLAGFTSTGAVDPRGTRLALVTVDGGTASHPTASVNVIDLETGRVVRAAANALPGQTPVWSASGDSLVFTRMPSGNETQGPIHLVQVSPNGENERRLQEFSDALGVYPTGYDAAGRLVTVVLSGTGSAIFRDGTEPLAISANLSRDWKVSPDGRQLAFVEVDATAGVRYLARTVALDGTHSEALTASVLALGAAWNPRTNSPSFGAEPAVESADGHIQSLTAGDGFDIPLAYSSSGAALTVNHWTGDSFDAPGRPQLQVVTPGGRTTYEDQTRFYGWSSR